MYSDRIENLLVRSEELRRRSRRVREMCQALADECLEVLERSERVMQWAQELNKRVGVPDGPSSDPQRKDTLYRACLSSAGPRTGRGYSTTTRSL